MFVLRYTAEPPIVPQEALFGVVAAAISASADAFTDKPIRFRRPHDVDPEAERRHIDRRSLLPVLRDVRFGNDLSSVCRSYTFSEAAQR